MDIERAIETLEDAGCPEEIIRQLKDWHIPPPVSGGLIDIELWLKQTGGKIVDL